MRLILSVILSALAPSVLASYHPTIEVPAAVLELVGSGMRIISCEPGDLNGDGSEDLLIVAKEQPLDSTNEPLGRTVFIIDLSMPNGKQVLARSAGAVEEDDCGGLFGDCFEGAYPDGKCLAIVSYGGGSWRSSSKLTFCYSGADRTWLLESIETRSFHVSDPDSAKVRAYRGNSLGKVTLDEYVAHEDYVRK